MKRLRWLGVLVLVLGVIGSGGYAVAQARQPEAAYSTATATRADVERTVDLSGTVTATGRRDLGFGTSGKVSKVSVKAGQRVRKGQVLARLDTTALDAEVTSAEATLARAKAQLASDEDAQASAVTDASTNAAGGGGPSIQKPRTQQPKTPSNPSTPAKPDPALQQALAELATGQKAVTAAQTAASEAITAAKAALTDQIQKCRAPTDDQDSTDGDDPDAGELSAACTAALAAVQAAQDVVAGKQEQLQTALDALSDTITEAVGAVTKASQSQQSSTGSSPSGSQSQGALAASTSTVSPISSTDENDGGGSSGGTVTAARLAQDQADIDTANARLGVARAARRLATLRAPYAGRILQADLARGDQASASDTPFVLVGQGVTTVTTTVTTAQVPDVRRGQDVAVIPAGRTSPMKGKVTEIGVLPDSSGNFPVTMTVESDRVSEGSTASVSIVTGVAKDAVTVPTSALTRNGNRAVVRVLSGQTVTRTSVTVGVVGTRRASITGGLKVGAKVVLADLAAEVPSSTTSNGGFRGPTGGDLGEGPRVQFRNR